MAMTRYERGAVRIWAEKRGGLDNAARDLGVSKEALERFTKGGYDASLERKIRSRWKEVLDALKPERRG
jgi:hypothetical protein